MTNEIENITEFKYTYFDGCNSQRTKCSIDDCYCDCLRSPECYFKQLQREKKKNAELERELKTKEAVRHSYEDMLFAQEQKSEQLIQALKEVKGIAENTYSICEECDDCYCSTCEKLDGNNALWDILKRIKEIKP